MSSVFLCVATLTHRSIFAKNLFDLQRFFAGETIRLESHPLALTFLNMDFELFLKRA